MKLTGRTVLITGGGSGIGGGLAAAFHEKGNKVIITGRRAKVLKEMTLRYKGMEAFAMDVSVESDVQRLYKALSKKYPALDVVINNAGLMLWPDFGSGDRLNDHLFQEIDVNLKGLIRMTATFLPLLKQQKEATLINVSSGLAYVPLAPTPIYCATKAAVHSFTDSLRYQLRKTSVEVLELAPPAVKTDLGEAPGQPNRDYPRMPLDRFIKETMAALGSGKKELLIGGAKFLKTGSRFFPGRAFKMLNP
jgi:short-subunit dehydrogenase involved in D-alanine esterification of teichoic acids